MINTQHEFNKQAMELDRIVSFLQALGNSHYMTNSGVQLETHKPKKVVDDKPSLIYVFDREYPRDGGYTVAYKVPNDRKNTKMVEVAVAYCSIGDTFNKVTGREIALDNFANRRTVMLPLRIDGEDGIHDAIRATFRVGTNNW